MYWLHDIHGKLITCMSTFFTSTIFNVNVNKLLSQSDSHAMHMMHTDWHCLHSMDNLGQDCTSSLKPGLHYQ